MFWPINAVMLLGFTRKCGLRNTSKVAGRDCLSPATLDATHLYTPLSEGRLSRIFKFPPSTTDILQVNFKICNYHNRIDIADSSYGLNTHRRSWLPNASLTESRHYQISLVNGARLSGMRLHLDMGYTVMYVPTTSVKLDFSKLDLSKLHTRVD